MKLFVVSAFLVSIAALQGCQSIGRSPNDALAETVLANAARISTLENPDIGRLLAVDRARPTDADVIIKIAHANIRIYDAKTPVARWELDGIQIASLTVRGSAVDVLSNVDTRNAKYIVQELGNVLKPLNDGVWLFQRRQLDASAEELKERLTALEASARTFPNTIDRARLQSMFDGAEVMVVSIETKSLKTTCGCVAMREDYGELLMKIADYVKLKPKPSAP